MKTILSQREAVFQSVCTVLSLDPNVSHNIAQDDVPKDQLKQIFALLFAEFKAGNVELKNRELRTDDWLLKYIPGLVNNWFRKDDRLNGGVDYVVKNPGIRANSGDAKLKALKDLLKLVGDDAEKRKLIEGHIAARELELKPKVTVDTSVLPAELLDIAAEALSK